MPGDADSGPRERSRVIERYLRRIGMDASPGVDLASLAALQRAHLTAVPFENLDVFHRRGVQTDPASAVAKIADEGRGGWCFELNGAFAVLLRGLGFTVETLGATVLLQEPTGPQPNHATIRVDLGRPYLVDVGFGDSFINPLPLDDPGPHDGGHAPYTFDAEGTTTTLVLMGEGGAHAPQYRFESTARVPAAFEPSSRYLQTAPGLKWTQHPFATRLLDGGPDRVHLLHDRLRIRRAGVWTETPVAAEDWAGELEKWFGMTP